jgi:hypothetical protein
MMREKGHPSPQSNNHLDHDTMAKEAPGLRMSHPKKAMSLLLQHNKEAEMKTRSPQHKG